MVADGRWRRRRGERKLLQLTRGIWLVGVSIALQVDMGETGRPFRTEDTGTVPLGSLELELAADLAYDGSDRGLVFPLLSLKTGLADRVEVGVETGYQFVKIEGVHNNGFTETALKAKVRFYDGSDVLPSIGASLGLILPTANRDIDPSGDLGFLAIGVLTGELQVLTYSVNFGVAPSGDILDQPNLDDNLLWGLAFAIPVWKDITLAIDFFGETREDQGAAQSGLIGGIWQSPWQIDFDFAVIVGMTRSADNFGLTMGLTYQFSLFGGDKPQQASRRVSAKHSRALQAGAYTAERTSTGWRGLPVRGL
jgi:hypothetical protein